VSEAAVNAERLSVRRGGREVVQSATFKLASGTLTGLLGPSGSGKTSLMRALVGVQDNVSGSATVLGQPAGSPGLRSRVGYVTQEAAVYTDLTVRENLRYFASVLDAPDGQVDQLLDAVDLAAHADDLVSTLSGGERSRVSLATALLNDPQLLVLDEPTVGLDPVLRRDLWALFRRYAASGVTLLVSSHVMEEANRCDRLLLMRDGQIIADDTEAGLLAATGQPDVERAFLSLVEGAAP
jgi:ABC-2 type transport system ATP-binding protein